MGESQDALGAAQGLLGMFTVQGLVDEDFAGGGSYVRGAFEEAPEGALDEGGMRRRTMGV